MIVEPASRRRPRTPAARAWFTECHGCLEARGCDDARTRIRRQDRRRLAGLRAVVATDTVTSSWCAERRADRSRRRWLRPARVLRVRHRHSGARQPLDRGTPPDQFSHHRPVLADTSLSDDRTQPPPERHGTGGRSGHRVPRLLGQAAPRERLPLGDPPGDRLCHLRGRQVAPESRGRDQHGRFARLLAARTRIRSVVRLPWRRDPPVHAGAVPRQPRGAASACRGGGLPPQRGSRRPRHRVSG